MYRIALQVPSARADELPAGEQNLVSSVRPQPARNLGVPRRSSKPYNRLAPSPLRPHVLARDRIATWRTPYSFLSLRSLSMSFSSEVISHWQDVVLSSVDPDTRGNYGAGLLRFNHFCDTHLVPEVERMPASETLLSMFVANYGAGHVAAGTISSWLSGLEMWHTVNNARWQGGAILKRTKKGAGKLAPDSSKRPPRDLVSLDHMLALRAGLDLSNTLDASIWAAACVAWRACTRLGAIQ